MFNKLKQIKNLRDQAKKIQSVLSQEMVENTCKGITIKMDGNQIVHLVSIADEQFKDKNKLEQHLIEAINETIKKVQKKMAMKLQQSGDFKLPGLN